MAQSTEHLSIKQGQFIITTETTICEACAFKIEKNQDAWYIKNYGFLCVDCHAEFWDENTLPEPYKPKILDRLTANLRVLEQELQKSDAERDVHRISKLIWCIELDYGDLAEEKEKRKFLNWLFNNNAVEKWLKVVELTEQTISKSNEIKPEDVEKILGCTTNWKLHLQNKMQCPFGTN